MTIRKGEDWGAREPLRDDAPVVASDRELSALFTLEGGAMLGPAVVGVTGGDLARTVGADASESELRSGPRTILPIDLGVVSIDGREFVMAASLVVRRRAWAGVIDGAMNASFFGSWNVAPRGHPNDGRFDVIRAELSIPDKVKAHKRLSSGTHVPHPNISTRRLSKGTFHPDRRSHIWIDGVPIGHAERVDFMVQSDAVRVAI
jgi:hypothetical protein